MGGGAAAAARGLGRTARRARHGRAREPHRGPGLGDRGPRPPAARPLPYRAEPLDRCLPAAPPRAAGSRAGRRGVPPYGPLPHPAAGRARGPEAMYIGLHLAERGFAALCPRCFIFDPSAAPYADVVAA